MTDQRILNRFRPREYYGPPSDGDLLGVYVDVETNGLGSDARIIELSVWPFGFDPAGRIVAALEQGFAGFLDPGEPLSPEITALTGLTDADLVGQSIDPVVVREWVGNAKLVVAHNAEFDRPLIEAAFPGVFEDRWWGCSYRDVPWRQHGFRCSKLGHLLMDACDEFTDSGHRAGEDCLVGIHLLASVTLGDKLAFAHLLDAVRRPTARIYAWDSHYDNKDKLKAHGYRWDGERRVWYLDTPWEGHEAEVTWLVNTDRIVRPKIRRFGARDRYSVRAG